jgi:hypothetical protein
MALRGSRRRIVPIAATVSFPERAVRGRQLVLPFVHGRSVGFIVSITLENLGTEAGALLPRSFSFLERLTSQALDARCLIIYKVPLAF